MSLAGFVTFSITQASGSTWLVLPSSRTDSILIPTRSTHATQKSDLKYFNWKVYSGPED